MENRFCFVAIVKNESHVIKRCIDSIANIATSYLICDTGSDDGTPETIESYMKEKNIPGEVIHLEWVNYGHNKSFLLDQAYTHNKSNNAKYLIWHDADEVFIKNENDPLSYLDKNDANELYDWLESTKESVIYIKTINVMGDMHYQRWNIVRNNQLYKWISPKHEWLCGTVDNSRKNYHKFVLLARKEGSASGDPNRCNRDAQMFLDYIDKNGGPINCGREVFYLAQEYESFDKANSIKYHKIKTKLVNDWHQERYISFLRLGRLCDDEDDKINFWTEGYKLIPSRLECIYELMIYYYKEKNDPITSVKWGCVASENRNIDENDLFVEASLYKYKFDLDFSISAYYAGKYQLSNDINQKNMLRNKDTPHIHLLLSNQKFTDNKLRENNLIKLKPEGISSGFEKIIDPSLLTNCNRISSDIRPSIIIIDNFYTDPGSIRSMALKEDFNVVGNYPGGRTKSFATDEIKGRFEMIMGKKITYWPSDYNGAFQFTTKDKKSWIHRDQTDYSGIVYLTPNAPADSGTVLYRHKVTGLQHTSTEDEEKILNNDANNEDAWEIMDVVGNKYNRLILFDGRSSHKSNVYFGDNKENGRLFQTFFFNTLR